VDLLRHPAIRVLLGLRALPQRAASRLRGGDGEPAPATFRVEDMISYGWMLLGENPSEIILGQISQPWKAAGTATCPPVAAPAFAAFHQPGYAKIAFSLRADPRGSTSSVLTMETRVALTDAGSRRRFRRYWMIISPFSGLIRRMALRLLTADLRARPPGR
jgi:hypothetical protein